MPTDPGASQGIRARIVARLEALGVPYESLRHPPVTGCDDSVRYRREAGWEGASSKCILFHAKGRFYLVVTTAEREIKARRFKREFGTKDIRFATPEEVREVTGCAVGSVPPFGHDGPPLPIYVDDRIFTASHFLFNPADPTESLRIPTDGLRAVYAAGPDPVTVFREEEDNAFAFEPLPRKGAVDTG